MEKTNIALLTDAYKQTHWMQYPPGTQYIYSYFESRGGRFDSTVFYGLQILLKKYLEGVVIDEAMVNEADEFCKKVFGQDYFNREGWMHIVKEHGGRLPIKIKAVPEGTVVPNRNVLMTIENTDPKVPFITNFLETLLVQVWYGSTVATMSREIKRNIQSYASRAGEEVSPFHLNDFGFRGASSVESAGIGGSAHLVNFLGTDNLEGIRYAMRYYNSNVCGFSVMAAEHSTVTSYGKDFEYDAYKNIIKRAPDDATVAVVCDSYDAVKAISELFGRKLKNEILARGGKVVIRPDSGDPVKMSRKALSILWDRFGGIRNSKGYRILNPKVGVIYGDYIGYDMINDILHAVVTEDMFAPSNIIFGMGGGLLQKVHRDTQSFALKCSAININGTWYDVFKQPATDATKSSKRGRMRLSRTCYNCGFETFPLESGTQDELVTVFENGKITKEYTFEEVRTRAALPK